MPARQNLLALSVATATLAWSAPALAQAGPGPDAPYEYAEPADEVIFSGAPVVQDGMIPPAPAYDLPPVPQPPLPPIPPQSHRAYAPPPPYAAPIHAPMLPPVGYAHPVQFDRGQWLDQCHDRIRRVDRKDRAAVIGGLLGAAAGGVIGNRAWASERLAGTLLGAGVGGLAGLAAGAAIGAAGERRDADDCAFYLDRAMAGGWPGSYGGSYAQPYGYGSSYSHAYAGYALVPVLVTVPQRQVVREIVTEEWVEEPVRTRSAPRRHHPAPRADKRIKLIKGN